MKIYKERQYLIFDFEDGKTVKYDFATKTAIGKKGKPVKNLKGQLTGLTIDELCNCCADKQYGKFLRFVKNSEYTDISNIGTILERVPFYSNYEQLYSAGFERVERGFRYGINDIPKGLRKICKEHDVALTNSFLEYYKKNPDAYQLAYNLEYNSLTENDIHAILCDTRWDSQQRKYVPIFTTLMNEYNYSAKALLNYFDYLKTFEAIDRIWTMMTELCDYCNMMSQISEKYDKFPRHFLTTHKIATRNYNRLKKEFSEDMFKKRINKNMEKTFGDYQFIYPNCTQDIKDESVQMNNCVSSYIDKVIDGDCHILFLRHKDNISKSLVTIEVRNNQIVQALQRFNNPCNEEQKKVIAMWNKWYLNKLKKESEEAKC